jgi:hypothetical protein
LEKKLAINFKEETEDKKVTKKKKEKSQEKKLLTNEEKYEIANYEAEILKKNIEEGRIKSDAILETLRVIIVILVNFRRDRYGYNRNKKRCF